jgi:hypothetical protein
MRSATSLLIATKRTGRGVHSERRERCAGPHSEVSAG